MDDLYKTLKDYFRFDKLQDIFLQVFEVILGLISGALIGTWLSSATPSSALIISTIASIVVLGFFTIFRLLKISHFPNTAIDYLKAKNEMIRLNRDLDRKKTVDEYIDKAIQSLNVKTCPLTDEAYDHLCNNPLEDGLYTVLQSIITLPQYILDCKKSNFTVALHLSYYPTKQIVPGQKKLDIDFKPQTITFRDDFGIDNLISDDILEDLNASGAKYQIHATARDTYNHFQLKETIISENNRKIKLITSPIPNVCEGDAVGVLFMFCDDCVCKPTDLDNVLLIFGRLIANWISKYEDCIRNREVKPDIAKAVIEN